MKFVAEVFDTPDLYNRGVTHKVVADLTSIDNPQTISAEVFIGRGMLESGRLKIFRDAAEALLYKCVQFAEDEKAKRLQPAKDSAGLEREIRELINQPRNHNPRKGDREGDV